MILLSDNYDSFTYNLYRALGARTHQKVIVKKNDAVQKSDLELPSLKGLVLSPGPGRPEDAGNMNQIIQAAIGRFPILGVCLGHQAIGEVYDAKVKLAKHLMHGKTDLVRVMHSNLLLKNCPKQFTAGRYHSLVIDPASVPSDLKVNVIGSDNSIQAISDDINQVYGLEFHTESIMTDQNVANRIFNNYLQLMEKSK